MKKPAPRATTPKAKPDLVEEFDVDQRGEEWHALRRGVPTASVFSTIMATGEDGEDSKGRTKLMYVMAGEILTGEVAESFSNAAMARGVALEPEAREHYKRVSFAEVRQIGFVRRTIYPAFGDPLVVGSSPDGYVDDDGTIEIKTLRPDLLIPIIKKGPAGLPLMHRAQCHGTLWVTGRKWCDLQLYAHPLMPKPKFRMERDEKFIGEIRDAVSIFDYDLRQLVKDIRARR